MVASGNPAVSASSASVAPNASLPASSSHSPSGSASSSTVPQGGVGVTESASASARFAQYMAGVEARRAASRRRREERLAALNAALDAYMVAGFSLPNQALPSGDPQVIENHSTTSIWSGAEDVQCVICCEDLVAGESIRTLPCSHVYHKECIDLWLQRSLLCCLCKMPINGDRGE
eukprot:TRINITY_DN25602_c0_g1_i2.p1 TRINITY_DN25602_c0_g1~~TRINITY_DN25602_c0_g1_i2.p1  ORF type:complete len:176 (-),score=27.11 TRINITY_DN25602_c0_g1_i2:499-1026(-)